MIDYSDLKKGVQVIIEGEPYEIIEARPLKMAQRRVVLQTKLRNLITGNLLIQNFQQGDAFEEAEISKFEAKFLYSHRGRHFFCQKDNPSKRFDLNLEQIGEGSKFLKSGQIVQGMIFEEKVINVSLPIKVQLKVIEAPPGVKGERAQPGTKLVTLETGTQISAPLFIEQGDTIEVNTETGEYTKRIE
jgi:elongation factor P